MFFSEKHQHFKVDILQGSKIKTTSHQYNFQRFLDNLIFNNSNKLIIGLPNLTASKMIRNSDGL